MEYLLKRTPTRPELRGDWDSPAWRDATVAHVNQFHRASSNHHPRTEAKVLYDDVGLYVLFRVFDRYVICRRTENQTLTSKDSCVEVYLQPFGAEKGYFNFEMNCGGALLLFYVTDPTRDAATIFRRKVEVPQSLIDTMRIHHSMPRQVSTEITEPVEWRVEYFIPYTLMEHYVGPIGEPSSRRWRGNFFKCADESSHPHWASWAPIGDELNFHVPRYFQPFTFE
jgi:hypothetical protein